METKPTPDTSRAKDTLERLLALMGLEAKVEQFSMEGAPLLHIESPDAGRLIGKFGQTLNDLQFLLNRMLYKPTAEGEAPAPRVIVDVERYRDRQRDELLKRAHQAADKVRRWGDAVELGPMNSFDRRTVHRAFAQDPEIETYSEEIQDESGAPSGRKKIILRLRQNQPPAASEPRPKEEVSEE